MGIKINHSIDGSYSLKSNKKVMDIENAPPTGYATHSSSVGIWCSRVSLEFYLRSSC